MIRSGLLLCQLTRRWRCCFGALSAAKVCKWQVVVLVAISFLLQHLSGSFEVEFFLFRLLLLQQPPPFWHAFHNRHSLHLRGSFDDLSHLPGRFKPLCLEDEPGLDLGCLGFLLFSSLLLLGVLLPLLRPSLLLFVQQRKKPGIGSCLLLLQNLVCLHGILKAHIAQVCAGVLVASPMCGLTCPAFGTAPVGPFRSSLSGQDRGHFFARYARG
mmetsp:Transcript_74037/g.176244  ORF Transcript_74037/g.176244 Transcript_74037/m.176244 type:complete len:213 (-) Transcript_74037:694-1332(-)